MAKKAATKPKRLHRLSQKDQRAIFARIDAMLARHGVAGKVSELTVGIADAATGVEPAPLPEAGPLMMSDNAATPSVGVSRCRKLPNGQVVCTGG